MIEGLVRAAIFAFVGIALGAWAGTELYDGHSTYAWPETTGTIEESRGGDPKKPAFDHYYLAYRYTVSGETRVGRMLRFGHDGNDGTRLARRYREGSQVTVYYDPANPARAVIERGAEGFTPLLKAAVALAMLGLSAVIARGAFVARRRRAAAEGARRGPPPPDP